MKKWNENDELVKKIGVIIFFKNLILMASKNSDGVMGEGYTITIGGSQGANPTLGELHQKAVPADQIKSVLKNLLIEQFNATPKT